jgi:Cof subfamily protein (haloacid dehalogenase superfamily)
LHDHERSTDHLAMPAVRLVATDLDGTLLGPSAELSPRTVAAIRQAHAAGIILVAATGRSHVDARDRLGAAGTVRWLVCSNGAVLYDRDAGAVVDRHDMDASTVPAAVDAIRAGFPEVCFAWESARGFGCEAGFLVIAPSRTGGRGEVADRFGPPYPDGVSKLMVAHPDLRRDALLSALRPVLVDGLVASASSVPFVDIAPPGVDKAFGVARLCERLGIHRDEVAALGDHMNDLALLRWAGRSVAMGDAHPAVLAAAREVTATCEEDGAAIWLEALVRAGCGSGDGSSGAHAVG